MEKYILEHNDKILKHNDKILVNDGEVIQFNIEGQASFSPSVISGLVGEWDFGDGTKQEANSVDKYYPDTSVYHVHYRSNDFRTVSGVYFNDLKIQGHLDIRKLTETNLIYIYDNLGLTSVANPINSNPVEYFALRCGLVNTLDISDLTGLYKYFYASNNPLLTKIINPVSSGIFLQYLANACNLTGTHDFSGLTGLGGQVSLPSNPLLTSIINPSSSQLFSEYLAYSCNLGYVDFKPLTNLLNTNAGIKIWLFTNNMSVEEVNHILADLDSMPYGTSGVREIHIGGTNAPPDSSSGGYDGLAAKASLIAKGFTVTTS